MFIFDARQMLLSVLCADECGVVWPYLLEGDNLAAVKARSVAETLRAEFDVVVEERRRRAAAADRLVAADDDVDEGGSPAVKRRRTKR
jgi:predicted signal transduction protein with EAL and GGDEF domain